MSLVMKKKIREFCNAQGYNVSKKAYAALDNRLVSVLNDAISKSSADKRKTVMEKDF